MTPIDIIILTSGAAAALALAVRLAMVEGLDRRMLARVSSTPRSAKVMPHLCRRSRSA